MTRTKSHSNTHGYPTPKKTTSLCDTQPTQPRPGRLLLTPHRDAFLHHLWGGVAQYSVWEIGPDKRKWGIRGEWGRTVFTYPGYSRPAHFLSQVAGSGDLVHRPDYTPNHQRSQARDSTSQDSGCQHDKWHQTWPVHSASLGHGMSCLDLTRTSHNRVIN